MKSAMAAQGKKKLVNPGIFLNRIGKLSKKKNSMCRAFQAGFKKLQPYENGKMASHGHFVVDTWLRSLPGIVV